MSRKNPTPAIKVIVDDVPVHLREIIPFAEEWGTWNPQQCDDIIDSKSTEELRPFVRAIEQHRDAIDAWLDTMPKDSAQGPEAANIFVMMLRNWHEAACELDAREMHGAENHSDSDADDD